MSFIKWEENMSVHIEKIDSQHKVLIRMINELHESMLSGKGKEALQSTTQGLVQYARDHFDVEEKLFSQYGYPQKDEHQKEHKAFIEKINKFSTDFADGKVGLSIEVMTFLRSWLKDHIMGCDQKYAPFFAGKGL